MSAPLEKLLRDARVDLVLARIESDPSIIREVISHLDSEIRSIKFNSINVLGELGEKSENAIPLLTRCLDDDDWSICREAARSLGKIGILAKDALPILSNLLSDKEVSIRKEAAIAIGRIKNPTSESLSALINALKDSNEEVRTEAANALGEIGSDAYEAIPELMDSLKDVNWVVRTATAQAISKIGKNSIKAIPALVNALDDDDWRVRYRVVNTLASMGEPAVPALLEILKMKNIIAIKEAIDCLGEIKIADPKIIDKISDLLTSRSEKVRGKAADALRSIGKETVPVLIKALEKARNNMKVIIISALGGVGVEANQAIPILANLLSLPEQEQEYNPSFTNILKRAIIAFLKDPLGRKAAIRVELARALGKIGSESQDAVVTLGSALNDPKYTVRKEAALSLGKLGTFASSSIPLLVKVLEDRNPDVRWRASEALGMIGVKKDEVIENLNNLIHDKCDYVCESAINALDNLTEQ
ncbi:MAG: HEAT repeat domain-containing protein [Candidatus Thorarchaeota archaeon]